MADAEGGSPNSRTSTALGPARCRGTRLFHVQLLLGCTALNVKRLADHAPKAQTTAAAAPQTPKTAASTAAAPPLSTTAEPSRWLATLLAAHPRIWDHAISLN